MNKTCKGCYAAITGAHPKVGTPHGCELGYKTENGKPLEECPKPKSWKQLKRRKTNNEQVDRYGKTNKGS